MKLNLHILKDDLREHCVSAHIRTEPWILYIKYAVIGSGSLISPVSDVLYIVNSQQLPEKPSFSADYPENEQGPTVSFICIGALPASWYQSRHNFISLSENVDPCRLLGEINQLFYTYTEWENQLQQVVDEQLPLKKLAACSFDLIFNGIYAQSNDFNVLFCYQPEIPNPPEIYKEYLSLIIPDNTTLTNENINELISDSEYNLAANSQVPTMYSGSLYGFRSLYYNIRINNVYVARLLFDEVIQPIRDKDYALIKVLGDYLGKALSQNKVYSFHRPRNIEQILEDLLNHKLLPESRIQALLHTLGWNMQDRYVCILLKIKSQEDTSTALEPLALDISQAYKCDCYTVRDNNIIFVCNLTQLKTDDQKLMASMLPTLRDNLLTASMSAVYHDFKDLYYYYQQALITREIGEKKDTTKWYFRFGDYHLDYLLYKCGRHTISNVLIPDGLKRLIDYDKEKGTEYTHLLDIYLKNERNIADTIREAYMHRNTFLYRIKRITEILNMNLDDPQVRLILRMAFEILRQNEQK